MIRRTENADETNNWETLATTKLINNIKDRGSNLKFLEVIFLFEIQNPEINS
jgi:hypothetical protein